MLVTVNAKIIIIIIEQYLPKLRQTEVTILCWFVIFTQFIDWLIDWNTLDEGFAAFMGEKNKFTIISINNIIIRYK